MAPDMSDDQVIDTEITRLAGRKVEFARTTFKGIEGYVPMYFNFMANDLFSTTISETEKESKLKFFKYLKSKMGEDDVIRTGVTGIDSKEDKGTGSTDGA